MTEHQVQLMLCKYLRAQYPKVIFASDYAAGIKLNKFQAAMQKMFKSSRGYPDIFIALPRQRGVEGAGGMWCGLYLELKKPGARVWLKDGTLSTDKHIQEQAEMLQQLIKLGYCANFAVGFEQAKRIIDWYVKGAVGNYGLLPPMPEKLAKELAQSEGAELAF